MQTGNDSNAGGFVFVHGVPYCVLECGIIVRYNKWAMCIMQVILRQLLALPCKPLFVVYAIFSLCRETIGEKCTTEWVQSTYTTSAWKCILSLLGCFCTLLFRFFPLSYFFLGRFFFFVREVFSMGTLAMYPK